MIFMKTAFEILGVPQQVDDATVKRAYLQKIKQYPPEQAHVQFQQIRAAYEAIKDERSRVRYQLFHRFDADFDKLLDRAFATESTNLDCADKAWFMVLLQATAEDALK